MNPPTSEREPWIWKYLDLFSRQITCCAVPFALTLIPAVALAVATQSSWGWMWIASACMLTFCSVGAILILQAVDSRRDERQWRGAGYPEIKAQVHWFGIEEEREDETIDNADSDADREKDLLGLNPESYVTVLRLLDSPDEVFSILDKLLTPVDMRAELENAGQDSDGELLIRFPAAKPPLDRLQPGTRFEVVYKINGEVKATGEIIALHLG